MYVYKSGISIGNEPISKALQTNNNNESTEDVML